MSRARRLDPVESFIVGTIGAPGEREFYLQAKFHGGIHSFEIDKSQVIALADRLAEAFAEFLHKRVREEWGYGKNEQLTNDELIREKYRGIRPAPGYPACPDHTEKGPLFELLDAGSVGLQLTESFAMLPAAAVSGFYLAHPDARYFAVGKIGEDQAREYAQRKAQSIEVAERWLAPVLAYDR